MTDTPRPGVPVPPHELIPGWAAQYTSKQSRVKPSERLARTAAAWGADEQLRLCVEWMRASGYSPLGVESLQAAMRPKPPSLKEQALSALVNAEGADYPVPCITLTSDSIEIIRRALDALPDD